MSDKGLTKEEARKIQKFINDTPKFENAHLVMGEYRYVKAELASEEMNGTLKIDTLNTEENND
jgi:hypothetical protein